MERLASGARITRDAFGRVWRKLRAGGLTGVCRSGGLSRCAVITGDPDDLVLRLADMPGERKSWVKVGLYEAVLRDGMMVNLLLEAIPDLHLRLDANRARTPLPANSSQGYVNPDCRARIAFNQKNHVDADEIFAPLPVKPAWAADESLRGRFHWRSRRGRQGCGVRKLR